MIELLFVACLSTVPDSCRERSLVFTDVSPAQCLMGAQPELARWSARHPDLEIRAWRCRSVAMGERDT